MTIELPEPDRTMVVDVKGSTLSYYTKDTVRQLIAQARDAALEEAQEACKAADLKADAEGIRLTLTAANQIIGALKGTTWRQDGTTDSAKTTAESLELGLPIGSAQEKNLEGYSE